MTFDEGLRKRFPQIKNAKLIKTSSVADPWYGNNLTKIFKTPEGKFFRISHSDCHDYDSEWVFIKEVSEYTEVRYK